MTNLVQFPGLGLSFELDRVAFSIGGMKDVYKRQKRTCRPMAGTPFLLPGTGICLNFRTMTVRPSNRKA